MRRRPGRCTVVISESRRVFLNSLMVGLKYVPLQHRYMHAQRQCAGRKRLPLLGHSGLIAGGGARHDIKRVYFRVDARAHRAGPFFAEYFEKGHLVVKRNDPAYWRGLLTFADVDHVVSTMGLHAPEITVTKAADPGGGDRDADHAPAIRPTDYTDEHGQIDPVRVSKLFAEGSTVILSGQQERLPKLAQFSRALEARLSCRVQTNIYLTPAGHQGFRPHYDSHDVIVLQLEGCKEWRIYDTPVELPLPSQAFEPSAFPIGAETDRFVLEPGDMVYVPRGLAHDAVATDTTSLHVTTGLMFRSFADLVVEAARLAAHKDPIFRRALPPGFASPGVDLDTMADQLTGLLHHLAETAPARDLVETFKAISSQRARRGQRASCPRFRGLKGWCPKARSAHAPIWFMTLARTEGRDGDAPQLILSCHGAEISLPVFVDEPLRFALSTRAFRVQDLPGDLDTDGKLVLVNRLTTGGAGPAPVSPRGPRVRGSRTEDGSPLLRLLLPAHGMVGGSLRRGDFLWCWCQAIPVCNRPYMARHHILQPGGVRAPEMQDCLNRLHLQTRTREFQTSGSDPGLQP